MKEHHHRKGEMEHHAMREKHKNAHRGKMAEEHAKHPKMHEHGKSHHKEMNDNRMLHDNHQEGIARKLQRHGDMEVGQHGKMIGHASDAPFKRNQGGGGLTPRKA